MLYLVQRVTRTDQRHKTGFDAKFSLDYMGSSEFEFGAVPASLKRMRATNLVLHTGTVTRHDTEHTVYIVTAKAIAPDVSAAMTAWLADEYPRGQENSRFHQHLDGDTSAYVLRTNAWWDITHDIMWSLDEAIARDLLAAVTG